MKAEPPDRVRLVLFRIDDDGILVFGYLHGSAFPHNSLDCVLRLFRIDETQAVNDNHAGGSQFILRRNLMHCNIGRSRVKRLCLDNRLRGPFEQSLQAFDHSHFSGGTGKTGSHLVQITAEKTAGSFNSRYGSRLIRRKHRCLCGLFRRFFILSGGDKCECAKQHSRKLPGSSSRWDEHLQIDSYAKKYCCLFG